MGSVSHDEMFDTGTKNKHRGRERGIGKKLGQGICRMSNQEWEIAHFSDNSNNINITKWRLAFVTSAFIMK